MSEGIIFIVAWLALSYVLVDLTVKPLGLLIEWWREKPILKD